jgi:DNA-binding transcriptional MerR regulator
MRLISVQSWKVDSTAYLRIGEVARRTGVSPELLRAWERRYGLLSPARSSGGFRLYGDDDVERVTRMRGNLDAGLSAAEAARLALAGAGSPPSTSEAAAGSRLALAVDRLLEAAEAFDETAIQREFDAAVDAFSTETIVAEVVLPALHELGERWADERITVAHEHFASNVIRGRLLGLARRWDQGGGPQALLACPPGELHDLGLIAFGLVLRNRGWRIVFLGADTPTATLADAVRSTAPQLVVVSATSAERLEAVARELRALRASAPLAVGGTGASEALADRVDALLLPEDVRAAADLAAAR